MMEGIIKSGLKLLLKCGTKLVVLSIRVIKNLLWKSIKRSGECGEPYLTYICGTVASLGFAGAVISVSHWDSQFSGSLPAGNCLNVLFVFQVYSFVVGKLLRFLADLEGVRLMLLITKADLRKIDADRRVDYACEKIWMLMIRVGFVVPLCIAHYVWQYKEAQGIRVELPFLALFLVFQLLQIRYWCALSQLHDMSSMFEIYVFNAQNRLKKKWQSSVLLRVQSLLKSTYEAISSLHSSHRELAVTYSFLVFSTLSTYTILSLGFEVVSEYPLTCCSHVFQLIFIISSEADLRMTCDFKHSTLEKNIPLWKGKRQPMRNVLKMKYLTKCLVYSITMGAAAHVISFYLNSEAVSEHSIKEACYEKWLTEKFSSFPSGNLDKNNDFYQSHK